MINKHPSITQAVPASAAAALERTAQWITRFGGRLAGTPPCDETAGALAAELRQTCGNATFEPFTTHPGAFYGFYRIDVVIYVVSLALLILNRPLIAGLLLTFMLTAAGLQFGWYVEFYDRFYPTATCHNVTAVLEPGGEPTRQLILSGHHDSAYELKFLQKHQKLYAFKIIVPDAFRFLAATFSWVWVAWRLVTKMPPPFTLWMLVLLTLGCLSVFTKWKLVESWPVPGAGDNLIASAMLVDLANLLADPARPGHSQLEHTRLVFASFDAEEAGLRGSRAWVNAHRTELSALPTTALNIDSIYNAADLAFLVSDMNGHIPLDRVLAKRCQALAAEAGYPARLVPMRFGGGGTDAAELVKAGVRATTLIAMPAGVIRDGLIYHTKRDTVEAVDPQAVAGCIEVAFRLAFEIDQKESGV
jgi:aminopeptidase YwaD